MQIRSVGIDLGKSIFHLVALGAAGKVLKNNFTQKQLLTFTGNMLRYRENGMLKSLTIGTVLEFRTKAEAQRSLADVRADINNNVEVVTFGQLCDRYLKEGVPERHTTASALRSMVKYRIRPYWFQERVSDMAKNPMAVEQWIKDLMTTPRNKNEKPRPLAPKSKGHTKAVFHRLFECAMRWRYLEVQRNPMSLIELHGSSKRTRKIVLVTTEQYQKLLPLLPQHCRVMVTLAMCLGLRVSEILGLRWEDVDLDEATLQVRRSVVNGHVEDTKTLAARMSFRFILIWSAFFVSGEETSCRSTAGCSATSTPASRITRTRCVSVISTKRLRRSAYQSWGGTPSGIPTGRGCQNSDCRSKCSKSSCAMLPST